MNEVEQYKLLTNYCSEDCEHNGPLLVINDELFHQCLRIKNIDFKYLNKKITTTDNFTFVSKELSNKAFFHYKKHMIQTYFDNYDKFIKSAQKWLKDVQTLNKTNHMCGKDCNLLGHIKWIQNVPEENHLIWPNVEQIIGLYLLWLEGAQWPNSSLHIGHFRYHRHYLLSKQTNQ